MDINSMKNMIDTVLDNAQSIVDAMEHGDKIKLSDLATDAGKEIGMDGDDALPFITFFAHNCDGVSIERGRNGGLYKGGKLAPVKKTKATGSPITDTVNGIDTDSVDSDSDSE